MDGIVSPDPSTFVETFMEFFVARVINDHGAECCRTLARYGWWTVRDQNINSKLAHHLRSTLNTRFGATMHRLAPDSRIADEYHAVVNDLLNGVLLPHAQAGDRTEIAFFLIKHSTPTYGRLDAVVDERLHAILTRLARDHFLTRNLSAQAKSVYEANHIDSTRYE